VVDRDITADGEEAGRDDIPPHPDADRDAASIREAISVMETLPRERRRFLAGFAYILVRVARADAEVNEEETSSIEAAVSAVGDLSGAEGALIAAVASRTSSLYGATEDFSVTREFARSSSPQQRQRLLRSCVAVAVADGQLTSAEETELYEIGRELGFNVDEIDAIRDQVEPEDPELMPPS